MGSKGLSQEQRPPLIFNTMTRTNPIQDDGSQNAISKPKSRGPVQTSDWDLVHVTRLMYSVLYAASTICLLAALQLNPETKGWQLLNNSSVVINDAT